MPCYGGAIGCAYVWADFAPPLAIGGAMKFRLESHQLVSALCGVDEAVVSDVEVAFSHCVGPFGECVSERA